MNTRSPSYDGKKQQFGESYLEHSIITAPVPADIQALLQVSNALQRVGLDHHRICDVVKLPASGYFL